MPILTSDDLKRIEVKLDEINGNYYNHFIYHNTMRIIRTIDHVNSILYNFEPLDKNNPDGEKIVSTTNSIDDNDIEDIKYIVKRGFDYTFELIYKILFLNENKDNDVQSYNIEPLYPIFLELIRFSKTYNDSNSSEDMSDYTTFYHTKLSGFFNCIESIVNIKNQFLYFEQEMKKRISNEYDNDEIRYDTEFKFIGHSNVMKSFMKYIEDLQFNEVNMMVKNNLFPTHTVELNNSNNRTPEYFDGFYDNDEKCEEEK